MDARRMLIGLVGAGLLLGGTDIAGAAKEFEGVTLTVASYGGVFDETLKASVADPLKEKYGISVVYRPGVSTQSLAKAIMAKEQPDVDLIYLDSPNMPTAIEAGVIDEVTEKEIPAVRAIYPKAREFGNYGVATIFSFIAVTYNTKKVKTPPTSLADFWNPEYKGRVAIFNLENNGGIMTLVALAESLGGGVNNVDPAFAKLKTLVPNLVSVTASTGTMSQLLQQEEALVAATWDGRILNLQAQGFPLAMVLPQEGVYANISYVNIIKGTKKRAAALKYLEQSISAEAAVAMAKRMFYAPTNSVVKLPDDVAEKVALYGAQKVAAVKTLDWGAVAKQRAAWIERWNKEMQR